MDLHAWKETYLFLLLGIPGVQAFDVGLVPTVISATAASLGLLLTCLCCIRYCRTLPKRDPESIFEPINSRRYGVDRYSSTPYDEVDDVPFNSSHPFPTGSWSTSAMDIKPMAYAPGYSPPPSYGSLFTQ